MKKKVTKSEIYAMHIENLVRVENNLKVRNYYIPEENVGRAITKRQNSVYSLFFIDKKNHSENYEALKNKGYRYK